MRRLTRALAVLALATGALFALSPTASAHLVVPSDSYTGRDATIAGQHESWQRVGSVATNYCYLDSLNDGPYSKIRVQPLLERQDGTVLDTGPTMFLDLSESQRWVIEPGAAVANSYEPRLQLTIHRWTGNSWVFVQEAHLGPFNVGTQDSHDHHPWNSQPLPGC